MTVSGAVEHRWAKARTVSASPTLGPHCLVTCLFIGAKQSVGQVTRQPAERGAGQSSGAVLWPYCGTVAAGPASGRSVWRLGVVVVL